MTDHRTTPADNVAALRQLLTEREQQLQQELRARLSDGRTEKDAPGRDGTEVADDNAGRDLSFAVLQLKSAAAADHRMALQRLDAGTYGNCLDCEQPISQQRLRALPSAVRCQPCAERLERRERSRAGAGTQGKATGAAFRGARFGQRY